jgi:hypothetical protein
MSSSCEEYRDFQRLLALKRRLAESNVDPEEREELEKRIENLENKLRM